ncbi:hypothetical protein JJL45_02225 [Tamlana sp. s12]|uniref:hypothetical protein n=1 Tax=Tamlana sp. s12 TaxID=1630406 RepID=UPI0007FE37D4|nr:hypothetical protein [Tamlana sp. s12]OBQ56993.1 hypothetical protein VQ01_00445 [Tamlana sp. s12]QQY82831.1 hypothetical protein JJL45_02225 [Tamlana sp. s12]
MPLYKTDKARFFAGLLIIILIYSLYYIYFVEYYLYFDENNDVIKTPRIIRQIIRFTTTIVVYLIGTIHLGKLKDSWMSSLWHLVHISGLCILTSLGLFDLLITDIGHKLKTFCISVQEILISPVLYVAMGLLNSSLNKSNNTELTDSGSKN